MYLAIGNWNDIVIPLNIKHLYYSKEYSSLVDAKLSLAKLIEENCPINIESNSFDMDIINEVIHTKGYARTLANPNKILTINEQDLLSSVYMVYVDENRPWTIIELEEYFQIIYLDNFDKKNDNYHEYKKD